MYPSSHRKVKEKNPIHCSPFGVLECVLQLFPHNKTEKVQPHLENCFASSTVGKPMLEEKVPTCNFMDLVFCLQFSLTDKLLKLVKIATAPINSKSCYSCLIVGGTFSQWFCHSVMVVTTEAQKLESCMDSIMAEPLKFCIWNGLSNIVFSKVVWC